MDCIRNCLGRLHLEMGNRQMFVQRGQVYYRMKISGLLWNKIQPAEEAQEVAPVDWLYAPPPPPPPQAGCLQPSVDLVFLFLDGKWMVVLVKRGWWHSYFNRTPNLRILDDLHSSSRFCHYWAKPTRRAPTNAPSLLGNLRWHRELWTA